MREMEAEVYRVSGGALRWESWPDHDGVEGQIEMTIRIDETDGGDDGHGELRTAFTVSDPVALLAVLREMPTLTEPVRVWVYDRRGWTTGDYTDEMCELTDSLNIDGVCEYVAD